VGQLYPTRKPNIGSYNLRRKMPTLILHHPNKILPVIINNPDYLLHARMKMAVRSWRPWMPHGDTWAKSLMPSV
jgi:hypothetical protein